MTEASRFDSPRPAPARVAGGSWSSDGSAPSDDRALAELARDDVEAFATLYRRHVRDVHAFLVRRCGSATLAEDVTAAAFERALRNLGSFRWRAGGFRAWVFRIALNELTDHHRREQAARRRDERLAAHEPAVTPDPAADIAERIDRDSARDVELRAAIDRLRPRDQAAITLRYLAGLDHREAAAAMGLSAPTFAVTLHRAMRALQAQLEDQQ